VDEERTIKGHGLGSVLCAPFRNLTLTVGWQDGHLSHKNPIPLIPRGSLPKQEKEGELADRMLTKKNGRQTEVVGKTVVLCKPH